MKEISKDLREKLQAIFELSKNGRDGEAENAKQSLLLLLDKHGLTLEDIDPDNTKTYWFTYSSTFERRLLFQIHSKIKNNRDETYWKPEDGRRRRVGFELTVAQHQELKSQYAVLREALKEELERCFIAFIHANQIFPDKSDSEESGDSLTYQQLREIQRMLKMANTMKPAIDDADPLLLLD